MKFSLKNLKKTFRDAGNNLQDFVARHGRDEPDTPKEDDSDTTLQELKKNLDEGNTPPPEQKP